MLDYTNGILHLSRIVPFVEENFYVLSRVRTEIVLKFLATDQRSC